MRTIAYIGLFWTQLDQNLPQVCIFILSILKFGRMLAFFIPFLDIYFIYNLDIGAMGTFSVPVEIPSITRECIFK